MFLWWNDIVISFMGELKSWTQSFMIVSHKHKLLEFLLEKNNAADFNTVDSQGLCAIERAIEIENIKIIKLLIKKVTYCFTI